MRGIVMGWLSVLLVGTCLGQAPVIANQPQNQTVCVGTDAHFDVGAAGAEPLSYQWRSTPDGANFSDLPGCTNATVVITNAQTKDNLYYQVVITNLEGATNSQFARLYLDSPPSIHPAGHPTNWYSASLGASVGNRVIAYSTTSMTYQWRLNGAPLAGQTKSTITLTNLQMADAGSYDVVVANSCGSTDSLAVTLDVDPTFTKITTGVIVTDAEGSSSGNWADYDNDGFPDLFVANNWGGNRNTLYHNDGGTNFSRVNTTPFTADYLQAWSAAWADFDNDGWVDLVVPCIQAGPMAQRLYRNNAGRSFSVVLDPGLLSDTAEACHPWWFDYNRDGFLDLFVSKGRWNGTPANDCLFRNNCDGTFKKMTLGEVGPIVNDQSRSGSGVATDYNDDGTMEFTVLQIFSQGGGLYSTTNFTWSYQPSGTFASATNGLPNEAGDQYPADYDNDGRTDALCLNWDYRPALYRNSGDGGFSNVTVALQMVTTNLMNSAAWGDYDNDGWLDLVSTGTSNSVRSFPSALFHNNRDGTFTQILTGSPAHDGDRRCGPVWIDYNNDGFLDLFIPRGDVHPRSNLLYRNNGNGNHWLKVKLIGVASNRSAIGARVRALASVNGRSFWQTRDISCGVVTAGQNGLLTHFGLGDATNVTTLKIEWPSGIVQTQTNIAANQFLTVVEHQEYTGPAPVFAGTAIVTNGLQLSITEPANDAHYILEASTNLVTWTKLMARTSAGGTYAYTDTRSANYLRRFYRVVVP